MNGRLWPSNQDEWDALAAEDLRRRQAEAVARWTELRPSEDEEPLSPEEEEMLF